ncbi:unnamed protein product, partial [Urochloa humidicola]
LPSAAVSSNGSVSWRRPPSSPKSGGGSSSGKSPRGCLLGSPAPPPPAPPTAPRVLRAGRPHAPPPLVLRVAGPVPLLRRLLAVRRPLPRRPLLFCFSSPPAPSSSSNKAPPPLLVVPRPRSRALLPLVPRPRSRASLPLVPRPRSRALLPWCHGQEPLLPTAASRATRTFAASLVPQQERCFPGAPRQTLLHAILQPRWRLKRKRRKRMSAYWPLTWISVNLSSACTIKGYKKISFRR